MKKNPVFEKYLAKVSPEVRAEVRLNVEISDRIFSLLKKNGMTQRDLAKKMGKKESEISRWLSGEHGYNSSTLAKLSVALGEPIVKVEPHQKEAATSVSSFVVIPVKYSSESSNSCYYSSNHQNETANRIAQTTVC